MSSVLFTAEFGTTVAWLSQLPPGQLPEIAFVGRSNAGKSSAINALCQRRRLAFASKTPGRTQALNFFRLGAPSDEPQAWLVDTPGYGFAAAPTSVREGWGRLAGRYLTEREGLRGVVLLVDCRRGLTDLDRSLLAFVRSDTQLMVLLTKADKLPFSHRQQALATLRRALQVEGINPGAQLLAFSVNTSLGLAEARTVLEDWLTQPPAEFAKKTPPGEPGGE
jgi:GTP-binding protein